MKINVGLINSCIVLLQGTDFLNRYLKEKGCFTISPTLVEVATINVEALCTKRVIITVTASEQFKLQAKQFDFKIVEIEKYLPLSPEEIVQQIMENDLGKYDVRSYNWNNRIT